MDRMNYNSANYNYNPDFVDGRRYNGDEHAINNASSSVDYNVPEYPINHTHDIYQMRPTYSYRPSSRNALESSNGYLDETDQGFNRGFVGHPNDVVSNLSGDANPLDERFSERSFAPSARNEVMPVVPERSISRNTARQPYLEQGLKGNSWAPQQGSFITNDLPSFLNTSYRPQSALNKSRTSQGFSFGSDSKFRKPELSEVIDFLSHQNDVVKANAAAYLQHVSYMDDDVKVETRVLRGIPPLLNLVNHAQPEVHRAACGALRNLCYGRANDDNKKEIKNNDGITTLVRLVRRTSDQEILELVSGIIWNLSSCAELKKPIIDEGLKTLLDQIIEPLARGSFDQNNFPRYRSIVFRNASGVLRNVSSDGDYARKKMRECEGLISSLIGVVQQSLANEDCDNKSIENCVCILRNLSYACQEVADPDYLRKKILNSDSKDPKTGCFGNKSKSTNKQQKKSSNIGLVPIFDLTKQTNAREMAELWSPEILDTYLSLLVNCTNPDTLEATAGTIQNLVACDWQPSKDLRDAVRNRKGIDIIIKLIDDSPDKVVCASARSLRNLALDDKCRDLIGKHAMRNLVEKLPTASEHSKFHLSDDTLLAILSTLYEVVKSNSAFARVFVDVKGVKKLMIISKSPPGVFDDKVVRYSRQLLQKIWKYGDLHDELKRNGWDQSDFTFPTATASGGASSADNTINRPIMSQGRTQLDNSFRKAARQDNGDLSFNQNSSVRGVPSYYSPQIRDEEVPLDALHAMQLSSRVSRENFKSNDDLQNSVASGLNGYGVDRSQGGFLGGSGTDDPRLGRSDRRQTSLGRDRGVYWVPGDYSNAGTARTSADMENMDNQLYPPVARPRNPQKNDSWV